GSDENSDALGRCIVYHIPELFSGNRIDSACRLVEENNLGLMNNGNRECQLLPPSKRQVLYQYLYLILKAEFLDQFIYFIFDLLVGQAIDTGIELDIFEHRKVFIQGELLAHISNVSFDSFGMMIDIN